MWFLKNFPDNGVFHPESGENLCVVGDDFSFTKSIGSSKNNNTNFENKMNSSFSFYFLKNIQKYFSKFKKLQK